MSKLNRPKVLKAIKGSGGVKSVIAARCGVSHNGLNLFLKKKPNKDINDLIEVEKAQINDIAVSHFHDLISKGFIPEDHAMNKITWDAIKFHLMTQCKNDGFTTKIETENKTELDAKITGEIKITGMKIL